MQRLTAIDPAEATGQTKKLLDGVHAKLGITPNLMRTLATAPAALEAYLNFGAALSTGTLDVFLREEIALAVGQANSCEYCLAAHTAIGQMVGLSASEILASRQAQAEDGKRNAGLRFAQAVVVKRGELSDAELAQVKAAGYTDGEIAEIVANVAVNLFTNYFNHIARTEVDFPRVDVTLMPKKIDAPVNEELALNCEVAQAGLIETGAAVEVRRRTTDYHTPVRHASRPGRTQ